MLARKDQIDVGSCKIMGVRLYRAPVHQLPDAPPPPLDPPPNEPPEDDEVVLTIGITKGATL